MPSPPPLPDPAHIETRLLIVAEMLEKAVAEVRRAMVDVKGGMLPQSVDESQPANQEFRND